MENPPEAFALQGVLLFYLSTPVHNYDDVLLDRSPLDTAPDRLSH